MFYVISSENDSIAAKFHPNTQVTSMDLWSEFEVFMPDSNIRTLCPCCGKQITTGMLFNNATIFGRLTNNKIPDIMFPSYLDGLIVSQKFIDIISANNLKGLINTNKVEVDNTNCDISYYNVDVGYISSKYHFPCFSKRKIIHYTNCQVCGKLVEYFSGIKVYNPIAPQYDIFKLYHIPDVVFISDKLRLILIENDIKGVIYTEEIKYKSTY